MNTKIKARVIGSVGRPVGVLPLDPRLKQNMLIPVTSKLHDEQNVSIKLKGSAKKNKSNSSTRTESSKRSAGSTRSRLDSSSGSKTKDSQLKISKRSGSAVSDTSYYGSDTEDGGQDVKFYNMPMSSRSRPSTSLDGSIVQKTIDPEEILLLNQESDFTKVYEIIQHGADLTDISNLQQFKRLKILDVSCNHIDKITGLSANSELKELKLYDNKIKVIENLDGLKELSCLQLQHNKIRSVGKGLSQLKKLKTLRLDSNQIFKLESSDFIACVQLNSLDLSFNMLDNLSALNYLPNLEELGASGNRLRKITELSRCRKLIEIDLSNNRINDLSGFSKLPHLQILKLSNNQISSLENAGRLKTLEELDISGNRLSELSPLSSTFPSLQILNVCDNNIKRWDEVLSLSTVEELVELFISGNPFGEEKGEKPRYFSEIQKIIPNLEILDGAHIKRTIGKSSIPLMRPMSASTVVSVRQMDNQLKIVSQELSDLQTSISQRFESLRMTCLSLPAEAPPPSARKTPVPTPVPTPSKEPEIRPCSSSRSRIRQAQQFAASQKFD